MQYSCKIGECVYSKILESCSKMPLFVLGAYCKFVADISVYVYSKILESYSKVQYNFY